MRYAALAVTLLTLSGCESERDRALLACDQKIMDTLKAPSTYKRVNASGELTVFDISYDAENSFGVPLRAHGTCFVNNGQASFFADPSKS